MEGGGAGAGAGVHNGNGRDVANVALDILQFKLNSSHKNSKNTEHAVPRLYDRAKNAAVDT